MGSSNNIAIQVKNLGKKYRISHKEQYQTLREGIINVLKTPFSFLIRKDDKKSNIFFEEFWALRNLSFDINKGEVIGIIGPNGAGKSTLLKILSRITTPTEGKVEVHGKIGSLLEVGTGFHPELTGRENIFLSGSILGMKKNEIEEKFSEIVQFSGIEKFLDTPVKRYSSGMYVRLAFAVAAHLEPDILLIDEVLAVGDAEFQKKCLGKMGDIAKEGRTVLFISHNMAAIQSLCSKTMLINNGNLTMFDSSDYVIRKYLDTQKNGETRIVKKEDSIAKISNTSMINSQIEKILVTNINETFGILIEYEIFIDSDAVPNFLILTSDGIEVFQSICTNIENCSKKGLHKVICWIPGHLLNNRIYRALIAIVSFNPTTDHSVHEISFEVIDDLTDKTRGNYRDVMHGVFRPVLDWTEI
jgi:lipopolysaccharide transport system ATP-binding protein